MSKKNYYQILEITKDASQDEIKKAYRKLALLYHPDKNPSPEASDKFKEIAEAYSILSDENKKRMYDMTGDESGEYMDFENMFGSHSGDGPIDPFHVFNSIFQQHMNSFMNMHYEKDINLNDIFQNISSHSRFTHFPGFQAFPNVKIQVHTVPVFKQSSDMVFVDEDSDEDYDEDDYPQTLPSILSSLLHSNLSPHSKKHKKEKKKIKKEKIKHLNENQNQSQPQIIDRKPENIEICVRVSCKDILNKEKKNIDIERMRKKKNEYVLKKKKVEISIYSKELILENEGHEHPQYSQKGDIMISFEMKNEENIRRIHEYDLLFKIFYHSIIPSYFSIQLPNDEIIYIQNTHQYHLGVVYGYGLPFIDDDGDESRGNLYISYEQKERDEVESLEEDENHHKEENKIYERMEKVSIFELFDDE